MERICVCCKKNIHMQDDIKYCPYCGTQMTHLDMVSTESNVVWKIETIWGNQAIYAEKVKMVCRELVSFLSTCISEQAELVMRQKSEQYITRNQMYSDFEFLCTAPNTEELEHEYQSFMRLLRGICSGKKTLREDRFAYNEFDSYIREKLLFFEAKIGIFANVDESKNEDRATFSKENGIVNFDEVFAILDMAFECVKAIIQSQGFICVKNCNFNKERLMILDNCSFGNRERNQCYSIAKIVSILRKSCEYDYSDLLDSRYEEHLIMFFESIYVVFQCVLSQFLKTGTEDQVDCCSYLDEWISNMDMAIDIAKNYTYVDMIETYLVAKKTYCVIENRVKQ